MPILRRLWIAIILCSLVTFKTPEAKDDGIVECQLGRAIRKQVKPTPLGGMCLKDIVAALSQVLRSIGNDELGLTEFQEMMDKLDFVSIPDKPDDALRTLTDSINAKLEIFLDILEKSLNLVLPILEGDAYHGDQAGIRRDDISRREKSVDLCSVIENELAMKLKTSRWKHLRVLPFLHRPGVICGQAGPVRNIGSLFLSQCDRPKNVIVLMEHGTFMSDEDISLARATAKTIVDMLSDSDSVTIIGLAGRGFVHCKNGLVKSTDVNKFQLIRRIDATMRTDSNESLILDLDRLTQNVSGNVVVVHVTNTLKDISNVTKIVKTISSKHVTVHLRTVLILSNLKPHVAVEETSVNSSIITLPTHNILGYDIARLFSSLECPTINKKDYYLSDSYLETYPYGKMMTLSINRVSETALVSLDIKLHEFVNEITYFNAGSFTRGILFDKKGIVLMHKSFPRIESLSEQPLKVYLRDIENVDERVVMEMIEQPTGRMGVLNKLGISVTLRWKHLKYLDLIVCVVTEETNTTSSRPVAKFLPQLPDNLLHHRLDTVSQNSVDLCNYKGHIQSLSHAVVYLSQWSLKPPLGDEGNRVTPQSYMAYIKDTTGLLANPGLSSSVRKDVATISQILGHFKKRHEKSSFGKFIVRRYVTAVESGVVEVYPGTSLESGFDPKRRVWYTKALEHPGKIVLSGPYLDAAGAGYVLTLSQTIFEGRRAALHTQGDPVVAIASMDITMGYMAKVIKDMLEFCNESTIKCFLMDDRGYLVSHPALFEPGTPKLLQQQHLTRQELLVSTDILNHEMSVKKKVCVNHLDGTVQRYYQFNTSLDHVLTNIIHGEHCVKYQMAAIPGTNLFFGVVNETCALEAFCPCSTMDRTCLNCYRMEQTECECPCECSLYAEGCQRANTSSSLEPCMPAFEQGTSRNEPTASNWGRSSLYVQQLGIAQCPMPDCKTYETESDCLGIFGCQWCSIDSDGESSLASPFCSDTYLCFKGVLGSLFPYADGTYNSQSMGDVTGKEWPSVGPVAGGILAVVLIFGISLFCYRLHSVQTGLEHQCLHLHGSPDTLRMTHLDLGLGGGGSGRDPEPVELDRPKNHLEALLLENGPPVSPYRVSTNYRRPAGGDSDHGYSTMTPHDDNEQQSFAEPLLLVGGGNEPESVRRSIVSSPSPITCLESPHRVLAPVTVHRNMETNYC
ncbi:VWFA and cache domain-containing protein 1 [Fopius arisanus]|uniref:VWFA and cache domain-containing protein 1 n=1 Tax=Fopius arisanus TaxID=64838 RepID=A0A9R1UA57_9HYME|nr:PREDICTED: VWFA and cache domain-containing protein 1 [Fopius arisanus]